MSATITDSAAPLVLLVEDNDRNARLVREILRGSGYQCVVAADGPEAIEAAQACRPQLILMDLQLPGMDGLTVTRKLKADAETADIPIVALTAHAMPEHRAALLKAGCCSYISKPISYRPFLAEIVRVLRTQLHPVWAMCNVAERRRSQGVDVSLADAARSTKGQAEA